MMIGTSGGWDPFVRIRPSTNISPMQNGCPPRDTSTPHFRLKNPREGNPEAPHVQTGDTRVGANAAHRRRDAQIRMNVARGQDPIVGIWPTAREAPYGSG